MFRVNTTSFPRFGPIHRGKASQFRQTLPMQRSLDEKRMFFSMSDLDKETIMTSIAEWLPASSPPIMFSLGGAVGILGTVATWYRSRSAWIGKSFLDRITLTMISVQDDKFIFRTLWEKELSSIIHNRHAQSVIKKGIKQTTIESSIIPLPHPAAWEVLNPVLNCISEEYSQGFAARDLGIPTQSDWYCFALTCERSEKIKFRKVRVLLVKEKLLDKVLTMPTPKFEWPHHINRWNTLLEMGRAYAKQKEKKGPVQILRCEVCVKC
eukprot:TRINITY_DN3207_c0_g1_i1.p1 TRINITY_DN3207_c0_g1~~TRINITY_DN3207_c0_g1_i1.p1  ORF type:complete len:266 (-),score=46.80 TRINITY_DN3207_c0_g1_i1:67-864(-)